MPSQELVLPSTDVLQNSIDQFKIAQDYFSDILQAQTAIFSVIVAIIIALYFFFNYKVSKEQIRKESEARFQELKTQYDSQLEALREQYQREFKEKTEKLESKFDKKILEHEDKIIGLEGSVHRTLGEFWDSQKNYGVAFIWWLRAAHKFSLVQEEELSRISLKSAKESVDRVKYAFSLNTEWVGEYQKLILEIGDSYKIEKDLLDTAIKEALKRKVPDTNGAPKLI